MAFNDQVQNLRNTGQRWSVFKDGVKTKWLTGQSAIIFRILPAYNYDDKLPDGTINPEGYLPCRTPDGALTSWGAIITMARYVGHGVGKTGNRKDFICPVTFTSDRNSFDAVQTLYSVAHSYPEWNYLIQDQRENNNEKGRIIERAAITRPQDFLALNVVELGGVDLPEPVIGLCTKSTTDGLVNKEKNGLVYQRANNVTPDLVRANPTLQWALGDITDPQNGPVFFVVKGKDNGQMSGYQIGPAQDQQGQIRHYPITSDLLRKRYDLTSAENFITNPDPQQTVDELVAIFNKRSPKGIHEHEFLRLAFGGQFSVPQPPAAPAAVNTVPSGFEQPKQAEEDQVPFNYGGPKPQGVQAGFPTQQPNAHTAQAPQMQGVNNNLHVSNNAVQHNTGASNTTAPGDAVPAFDKNAFLSKIQGQAVNAPVQQ